MQLETYIKEILAKPDRITDTILDLDGVPASSSSASYGTMHVDDTGTLLDRLRAVQTLSEKDVLEYGCNLYWDPPATIRLGKLRKGEKDSVGLKTDTAKNKAGYLGDFHVHPYKLKGSAEAQIGPSTGDIDGWVEARSGKPALFLVFAGKALCISIFREATLAKQVWEDQNRAPLYQQTDYQKACAFGRDTLGYSEFNEAIMDMQKLTGPAQHLASVAKEREMWDKIPDYAKVFTEANKQMNKDAATALRYEYFMADTTQYPVTAALVSERVYRPSGQCVLF